MDSRRDFTMPRSMAMMSSSGTWSMPLGRDAMSVSFSLAMIMRKVEVRAAVPAFIDSFTSSVRVSLRSMTALLREDCPRTIGGGGAAGDGAERRVEKLVFGDRRLGRRPLA